ncbi:Tat pathway signal sequence domain protein [Acidobacteria bacterium AB60]|nr:Tat pathway signal sequence domain protein [Acidobacteria bacterium AB60]
MREPTVSRRRLMQMGLGTAAAGLAATAPVPQARALQASPDTENPDPGLAASIRGAYAFLNQMMDSYATGSTVRMIQSYSDQIAGGTFASTAFVYDNAVALLAYLARGRGDDLQRAVILGNALLYAQQNDPAADGRFRQAYYAGVNNGGVYVATGLPYFQGSAVGDVAWAGIALAQLYARTGVPAFLQAAVKAATFIDVTTKDPNAPGGFFFGNGQTNKSTEHNIDCYALFSMLARLTGNATWQTEANYAKAFVEAMFDAPSGHFWTGTSDPTNIFYNNSPEDVNTWSYLAFQDPAYASSVDWVKTNLATTDTSFAYNNGWAYNTGLKARVSGMTFASLSKLGTVLGDTTVDADAVWLEGTGHLIAALFSRRLPPGQDMPGFHGDVALAYSLLESCQIAQSTLGAGQTVAGKPLVQGQGLTASTSILNTGFGFNYFPCLHIGATGWYLIGAQQNNPLILGGRG